MNTTPNDLGRNEATPEDAILAREMLAMLSEFRKWNPNVTVNQVATFLLIVANPGMRQKDTLTALGLVPDGQSRIVMALSNYGDRGRPGFGVVRLEENPVDRREKNIYLTTKGRLVWASIKSHAEAIARHVENSQKKGTGKQ